MIAGGLLLLVLGYFLGSFADTAKTTPPATAASLLFPLAELMESGVIGAITSTASGEVIKISGRTLTLEAEGDIWNVPVREGASVHRLVRPEVEELTFEEIKIGDRVDIALYLKADGTIEGRHIAVLP